MKSVLGDGSEEAFCRRNDLGLIEKPKDAVGGIERVQPVVAQRSDDPTNRAASQYRFLCVTWMTLAPNFLDFRRWPCKSVAFWNFSIHASFLIWTCR
jgi:hypothetical protein